jgi:acetyltransferase-like isoleucine patch superfamily enzyme
MSILNIFRIYFNNKKQSINQTIIKFKLRQRGIVIGQNTYISGDCLFKGNNKIGRNTIIGLNVILHNGASAGSNVYLANIEIGENSKIESGVICTGDGKGKITIGRESYIGINNILDCSDNLSIGSFVHIAGPSTGVYTHSGAPMASKSIPLKDANPIVRPVAPVTIADNVYIGPNCTISPGITINHHSVISPNSLVTRDVPPHIMAGGVPARKWWEYPE